MNPADVDRSFVQLYKKLPMDKEEYQNLVDEERQTRTSLRALELKLAEENTLQAAHRAFSIAHETRS
jgi:hypothetical protein